MLANKGNCKYPFYRLESTYWNIESANNEVGQSTRIRNTLLWNLNKIVWICWFELHKCVD